MIESPGSLKGPGVSHRKDTQLANGLIVSSDDIRKAVAQAEEEEKRALKLARKQDIANGKPPRKELHPDRIIKPGKDIVLGYIKNPNRRETPRCTIKVMTRDTNGYTGSNGYKFLMSIPMVRNRELADKIADDLRKFTDYILDEYDIPKRIRK